MNGKDIVVARLHQRMQKSPVVGVPCPGANKFSLMHKGRDRGGRIAII
jgi:hypothetical protein